jgi:PKD repeat protein
VWVRADTAGATFNLRLREYNNTSSTATLLGTPVISTVKLTTSWQLVTVTLPVTRPGSTFDFNAYISGAAPGTCFYADDATIYNGPPVESAPNASLTVSKASGLAPLPVTADASASSDTDSTPIASYTFDFGDGSSPVSQAGATANHTYTTPGTYTVKVTVTDTAGNSSSTTTQVYVGDAAPSPALNVSPTSGNGPLQVTADASASTDPDSTGVAGYTFDFGDGSAPVSQARPTAAHLYPNVGKYTVTVTATDSAGNAQSTTRQVLVTDAPPTAGLIVTPASGSAPLQVSADASSSSAGSTPIASYKFDFGDGSGAVGPQAGATASHTYTSPGTYTVTMTVTDSAGHAASTNQTVSVTKATITGLAVKNKTRKGATVVVSVNAAGGVSGAGKSGTTGGPGSVSLVVKLSRAQRQKLAKKHRLTVTVSVTFRPNVGSAVTQTVKITFES